MVSLYTSKTSDLHAHTIFSDGEVSVLESLELRKKYIPSVEELGVSDHYREIIKRNNWKEYVSEIKKHQELFQGNGIRVLVGIEIYWQDLIKDFERIPFEDLDYVIIENYERISKLEDYDIVLAKLKQCFSKPILLAHPEFEEIIEKLGETGFRRLLRLLREKEIALEMNLNWGYWFASGCDPKRVFYEQSEIMNILHEEKALLSIGTDAHSYDEDFFRKYSLAMDLFQI
ncbi:MAG: hypothetical protein JW708_10325 [Vallitaleaceae bacterium]|nr:hypothetical protein [Vallitaleaceae bacterium]